MANYVLAYRGGAMAESPAEQEAAMTAWMNWFGALGDAIVDMGSPFGGSSTIGTDGSVKDGGASSLTGYSIVSADSQDDAVAKAKGCPVLQNGGSVEVYESVPVG